MKRKSIYLSIIFITAIFALFFFNTTSYAGSQTMRNLEYDVKLNEDGSADVTEIWDISVYDTNTLFKTFKIDSSKYGEITNVKVAEVSGTGKISEFTKTDTYAYHVQKGYYYALKTSSSEFEIAWGVSIGSSSVKKYQISYTVTNAVKTYNDCSEFYWQFIGTSNGIPVDNITGTIKLPKAVSGTESIKVWAHGPLNGEIYATDSDTVSFNVGYLNTGTMVEVRIAVLENVFTLNKNIVNSNKLQSIISEETTWADAANRERDRLKAELEREKMITKIIGIAIVTVGIGIVIFFIIKIIKYVKELVGIKKQEPETKVEYYRDFPDEGATPTEAAFLYYFDKEGQFKNNVSKIVSAIILDLALKNVIVFETDQKEKVNIVVRGNGKAQNLERDELTIYNLLEEVEHYKNKKAKIYDNKISMKDIEKYAKHNDRAFLGKIDSIETYAITLQGAKKNYDSSMKKTSEKWKNKGNGYFLGAFMCLCFSAFVLPLFAVIPCIMCGVLCKKIANKLRLLELTQKGVNEQELWKGLKNYMENFSLLNEREVPELVLWEKYLVYATAFGISDKVLKQLKIKYPELMDEEYMLNNGYMYMYMMDRYNFDRVLNSSMQSAYNAGLRERAAREAAAASSYSSGGGRRRRLLRRRTAGGGGRRPEWAEDKNI